MKIDNVTEKDLFYILDLFEVKRYRIQNRS